MGITIEKMYGSYSDADLNDWEKLPLNVNILTSSAFGAWLLRRDESRDTSIKAEYENRLKADLKAILVELQLEIEELRLDRPLFSRGYECYGHEDKTPTEIQQECSDIIQQKINSLEEQNND